MTGGDWAARPPPPPRPPSRSPGRRRRRATGLARSPLDAPPPMDPWSSPAADAAPTRDSFSPPISQRLADSLARPLLVGTARIRGADARFQRAQFPTSSAVEASAAIYNSNFSIWNELPLDIRNSSSSFAASWREPRDIISSDCAFCWTAVRHLRAPSDPWSAAAGRPLLFVLARSDDSSAVPGRDRR